MSGLGDLDCGESLFGEGSGGTTVRNLGFEIGSNGFADSWELEDETLLGSFAGFGLAAFESFEIAWDNDGFAFVLAGDVAALFSTAVYVPAPPHDDFERGWSNFPYSFTSFTSAGAVFTGPEDADGFESGWDNDSYLMTWAGGTAAVFDGHNFEDFEQGWSNDAYVTVWTGGETTDMVISGVIAKTVEDFEDVKVAQSYTADALTDRLFTTAHGLSVNYRVVLATPIGGAMPTPLVPGIPYYVQLVADADTFKLALIPSAGSAIGLSTTGSGLLKWSDPYEFWTEPMVTF